LRSRIEAVLDYAKALQLRSGDNPAQWEVLEHILPDPKQLKKSGQHAALPYAEVPSFMEQLRKLGGAPARALEFTILTAARTGEALGAQWSEVDLEAGTWTVPASRMKAKREHRVTLSSRALAILRAMPKERGNPYIFFGSTSQKLGDAVILRVLKNLRPDCTVHGFRSSFRDWAAERSNFDDDVIEMALAHRVGNSTLRAYKRTDRQDQRGKLMEAWAVWCSGTAEPKGKVVPMHRR
jgi:integrase